MHTFHAAGSSADDTRNEAASLTWEKIEEEDDNMLIKLEWPRLKQDFLDYLKDRAVEIQGIVSQHLFLRQHQECTIAPQSEWMHGDFNVCIPISVNRLRKRRYLIRCPFPHMFRGPDGIDEKIRCEAASFAWISQHCPRVPIPHLWGFGLPDGSCFTPTVNLPWFLRALNHIKLYSTCLRRKPRHPSFLRGRSPFALKSGYLLVDFIEEEQGVVASKAWPPDSEEKRRNLYKSLSRIMLEMASHPLEKIGSLTVQDTGEVSLSNRPLTPLLPLLEIENIPTNIPRSMCYSTTDSYLLDLLQCHDQKLIHQPNAVRDADDAEAQMAVFATLRTVIPSLTQKTLNRGPFILCWNDKNLGNIIVDDEFNITSIVDLEWCCFLPIETQHPPLWLSGHALHNLLRANEGDFTVRCEDFLAVFEQEDSRESVLGPRFFAKVMRDALSNKTHWLMASLNEPRATYNLFLEHLQTHFAPTHSNGEDAIQFQEIVAPYWTVNAAKFIDRKLQQREHYLAQLRSKHRNQYA